MFSLVGCREESDLPDTANVRFRDVFVPQSDVGDTRSRTDLSHLVQFPDLSHALALASSLHSE